MLVLASASPRRRQLLAQAGYSFEVRASCIPEVHTPDEDPIAFAIRMAREKAQAVFKEIEPADPEALVLGADTIVVADNHILGKPSNAEDAARMLRLLRGRTHQVITGVALVSRAAIESAAEVTTVSLLTLSDEEIEGYIATGEPMDKAGGYAIQGRAAVWIPRIHGCYFNVVGLPLALVGSILEATRSRQQRSSIVENAAAALIR